MQIDKITAIDSETQLVNVTITKGDDSYKYQMNTPVLEGDALQAHCDAEELKHLNNILYQVYDRSIQFETEDEWNEWIDGGCKIDVVVTPAIEAADAVMGERQKTKTVDVEEEISNTEIVKEGGKYIQKITTETVTKRVTRGVTEEVDLYDEAGEKIGKHTVPVMESYEVSPSVDAADAVIEKVTISKQSWVDSH